MKSNNKPADSLAAEYAKRQGLTLKQYRQIIADKEKVYGKEQRTSQVPDEQADSDHAARAITNAETPEDLRWALQMIRVDEDFAPFEPMHSHGGFARYRPLMQEMMLRMRDENPKLPSVPTGDDSVDYVNWCIDAEAEIAQRSEPGRHVTDADTPVTLKEFMQTYCVPLPKRDLVTRRVESLKNAAEAKKVALPQHIEPWRQGQSHKYLPSSLKKSWLYLKNYLTDLPDLK
jgi:hypothetical protein